MAIICEHQCLTGSIVTRLCRAMYSGGGDTPVSRRTRSGRTRGRKSHKKQVSFANIDSSEPALDSEVKRCGNQVKYNKKTLVTRGGLAKPAGRPTRRTKGIKNPDQNINPVNTTMDKSVHGIQGLGGGMPSPQPPIYSLPTPTPPKLSANVNMNPPLAPHPSPSSAPHVNATGGSDLQSYGNNSTGFV